MNYDYFGAPQGKLTEETARQWHADGRAYCARLFQDGLLKWSLDLTVNCTVAWNRFFDQSGREMASYVWERRSGDDAVLTLGQAGMWWYRDTEEQWNRRMTVSFKLNGDLWRSSFNRDTQQHEDTLEKRGATRNVITLPCPAFGEYNAFREMRIEPVYTWLLEFHSQTV